MKICLLDKQNASDDGHSPAVSYIEYLLDGSHEVAYLGTKWTEFCRNSTLQRDDQLSFALIPKKKIAPFIEVCIRFGYLLFVRHDIVDVWSTSEWGTMLLIRLFHPTSTITVRVWKKERVGVIRNWLRRRMIVGADAVIVESADMRREILKMRSRAVITVPYGKECGVPSDQRMLHLRAYDLEPEKYILGVSDIGQSRAELFRVVRVFERLLRTNRIANNIPLVLIHPELKDNQERMTIEALKSTQDLLRIVIRPDRDLIQSLASQCRVFLSSESVKSEADVRDVVEYGRPIISASLNPSKEVKDYIVTPENSDTTLSQRLSYAINVPYEQIASEIKKRQRKIHRRYDWTSIGKKSVDIYQDAIVRRRSGSAIWRVAHQERHRYI